MSQGYKDFTAGSALGAADLEDYCQNQSVMRFASSAARDTALSSVKTEGMLSYQTDNNDLDIYTGSAFSTLIAPAHGAWTAWTPTVTQSGSVSGTTTGSYYIRIGRLVIASLYFAPSSSGTAANAIVISLPVTARDGTTVVYAGPMVTVEDTSAAQRWAGPALMVSTTTFKIQDMGSTGSSNYLGASTFTAAITTGDFIYGQLMYEAAADA